jgi:hypothetical protein
MAGKIQGRNRVVHTVTVGTIDRSPDGRATQAQPTGTESAPAAEESGALIGRDRRMARSGDEGDGAVAAADPGGGRGQG